MTAFLLAGILLAAGVLWLRWAGHEPRRDLRVRSLLDWGKR